MQLMSWRSMKASGITHCQCPYSRDFMSIVMGLSYILDTQTPVLGRQNFTHAQQNVITEPLGITRHQNNTQKNTFLFSIFCHPSIDPRKQHEIKNSLKALRHLLTQPDPPGVFHSIPLKSHQMPSRIINSLTHSLRRTAGQTRQTYSTHPPDQQCQ